MSIGGAVSTIKDLATYYSEQSFFDAWARGVKLADPRWFKRSKAPRTKYDLAPDYDAIMEYLGVLSTSEAAFLAAMYCFYNSRIGNKMLESIGVKGLGEIASVLDEPRRRVIADLIVSYEGW